MPLVDQMIEGTHEENCIRGSVLKFQMTSLAVGSAGKRRTGLSLRSSLCLLKVQRNRIN